MPKEALYRECESDARYGKKVRRRVCRGFAEVRWRVGRELVELERGMVVDRVVSGTR